MHYIKVFLPKNPKGLNRNNLIIIGFWMITVFRVLGTNTRDFDILGHGVAEKADGLNIWQAGKSLEKYPNDEQFVNKSLKFQNRCSQILLYLNNILSL